MTCHWCEKEAMLLDSSLIDKKGGVIKLCEKCNAANAEANEMSSDMRKLSRDWDNLRSDWQKLIV